MSSKPSLNVNQSQQLQISDNLQQAIKLLQLSSIELNEFLTTEIERNPLLSEQDDDEDSEDNYHIANQELRLNKVSNHQSDGYNFEDNPSNKTLREHVIEQIYLDIHDKHHQMIAFNLADLLSDTGYIEGDLKELAKRINVEEDQIEYVLSLLQKFDPVGIFAKDLAQCLKIQLQDLNKLDDSYNLLLENLDLIGSGGSEIFKKKYFIDDEHFRNMILTIRSLNPKPGTKFITYNNNYMEPEIYVRREKNAITVELNSNILPKILVDRKYYSQVRKKTKDQQEKQYLSELLSTANWLVKSLDQRAKTLLKVATQIVSRQDEFFNKGIAYLRPMTISDIANDTGLHESSISRITTNKFMSTNHGLFEMKFFFSSKLGAQNFDEDYSSTVVKHLIKNIISDESTPLSDQKIAQMLKDQNINIARRTVTKYRESLKIPTSSFRRQNTL